MSTAAKELLHQTIELLSDDQVQQLLQKVQEILPPALSGTGIKDDQPHSPDWDRVFANKLAMKKQPYALDLSEVSCDDFLF